MLQVSWVHHYHVLFMINTYYGECRSDTGGSGDHTDDIIWDGQGCFNNSRSNPSYSLPWPYHHIPLTANEYVET